MWSKILINAMIDKTRTISPVHSRLATIVDGIEREALVVFFVVVVLRARWLGGGLGEEEDVRFFRLVVPSAPIVEKPMSHLKSAGENAARGRHAVTIARQPAAAARLY